MARKSRFRKTGKKEPIQISWQERANSDVGARKSQFRMKFFFPDFKLATHVKIFNTTV